jgi:hypothetical protein
VKHVIDYMPSSNIACSSIYGDNDNFNGDGYSDLVSLRSEYSQLIDLVQLIEKVNRSVSPRQSGYLENMVIAISHTFKLFLTSPEASNALA